MERQYNMLSKEHLTFAQEQRAAYFLTEDDTISIRLQRHEVQMLRRFFGQYGMTPQEAMKHFAMTALEKHKVIFDENGFKEECDPDA